MKILGDIIKDSENHHRIESEEQWCVFILICHYSKNLDKQNGIILISSKDCTILYPLILHPVKMIICAVVRVLWRWSSVPCSVLCVLWEVLCCLGWRRDWASSVMNPVRVSEQKTGARRGEAERFLGEPPCAGMFWQWLGLLVSLPWGWVSGCGGR